MCETCGCGDPEIVPIEVQERILSDNDAQAAHNRKHFNGLGVLAINLMGSPGAGKTAVLEATAKAAAGSLRLGAVSGDLATDRDADRLNAAGIVSVGTTLFLERVDVLDNLVNGRGKAEDVDLLVNIANNMMGNTICAFADGTAMPLMGMVRQFSDEFFAAVTGDGVPEGTRHDDTTRDAVIKGGA